MIARLAALVLLCAAPHASAAVVMDSLTVQPNPAILAGGTPPLVEITVTVNRAQTDRQSCDVVIEPGDGGRPLLLTFAAGDKRKSLRYSYSQPGPYTVRALAGTGCTGTRSATLEVRAAGAAAAPAAASAVAAAAASVPEGSCPGGWYVVPESVQGARYSCQPNLPAVPLRCASGTRYFAENGVIGCR